MPRELERSNYHHVLEKERDGREGEAAEARAPISQSSAAAAASFSSRSRASKLIIPRFFRPRPRPSLVPASTAMGTNTHRGPFVAPEDPSKGRKRRQSKGKRGEVNDWRRRLIEKKQRACSIKPAPCADTRARALVFRELPLGEEREDNFQKTYVQTSCATWLELTRGGFESAFEVGKKSEGKQSKGAEKKKTRSEAGSPLSSRRFFFCFHSKLEKV